MKITQVEAIPFAIPYSKPLRFASGEVHVAVDRPHDIGNRRQRRSERHRPVPGLREGLADEPFRILLSNGSKK